MKNWRIQGHHDLCDAFYVEAETEEEAVAVYRKKWDEWLARRKKEGGYWWRDYGEKQKPTPDGELSINVVGNPEIKWNPRPVCCERINHMERYHEKPPVILNTTRRNPETGDYFSLIDPHWILRKSGDEISFCPFCGAKLPEVERMENPPQPLWDGDDDYCGTCDERNHGCECNPPWTAYRIKT